MSSTLAFIRRWLLRAPLTPVTEGDKLGRHFKVVKSLWCRCIGCTKVVHCHGLCKDHVRDKRRNGYSC